LITLVRDMEFGEMSFLVLMYTFIRLAKLDVHRST
jgi:hypothetical protein